MSCYVKVTRKPYGILYIWQSKNYIYTVAAKRKSKLYAINCNTGYIMSNSLPIKSIYVMIEIMLANIKAVTLVAKNYQMKAKNIKYHDYFNTTVEPKKLTLT